MSEELKPCPFCGGGARLDQRVTQSLWNSSDAVFSHVSCDDCDIQGQDFCDDPDGSEAIEWWNTRAAHPAPDAEAVEVVAVAFITRAEKSGPKIAITLKKEAAEQQHKNWLSMSKTITTEPLMTVAQHNRIMAATVPAGSRVAPVELLERLVDAETNERHRTVQETRYWCDQYKQIARALLEVKE